MLVQLHITNYALIQKLTFSPSEQMNAITGETGAGKSILLGALGLLLGNRADTKVLLDDSKKCVVEGTFNVANYKLQSLFNEHDLDHEDETIIRREISPAGKSRAFINDTPTTLDVLKQFGVHLMDVHSQHDNLVLGANDYQRFILDAFCGNQTLIEKYQADFRTYKEAVAVLEDLKRKKAEDLSNFDFNKKRWEELDHANLDAEEFNKLTDDLKVAENAHEIKSSLLNIIGVGLGEEFSAQNALDQIQSELRSLSSFSSEYTALNERVESISIELKDILSEVERAEQNLDIDEQELVFMQERLDLLNGLLFKYNTNEITELEEIRDQLASEVSTLENLDGEIESAQKKCNELEAKILNSGRKISDSRSKNVTKLADQVHELLSEMGMPNARLDLQLAACEPYAFGLEKVNIMFSANKGVAPQPLKKTASGGEFSRLLFSIKFILASKTNMPTIVFDEIDTGVSGEISRRMGTMMQKMAKHHQVITITHLPQVASIADRHFFVYKEDHAEKTQSAIKELNGDDRLREIAKMLSGDNPTEAAFQNAKELLSLAD